MINLYDSNETAFTNNGIVILNECISCIVEEELNGMLEATIEYPLLDTVERFGTITPMKTVGTKLVGEQGISEMPNKWIYLVEGNIIKVDGQLFRIYHKRKTSYSIKVEARHIYYDLADNFLEDVRPTNKTGLGALQYILANTQYPHGFTATGDVGGIDTRYFVRTNPIDAIMGTESILSTYQGELVRDNFNIGYWQNRGNDNGYLIMGGKNIIGIEEALNMDNVVTRPMPIGKDGLLLPEKYVDSQYINNYPHPKIKVIEFNDITTENELRTATEKYILDSKCDLPLVNFNVDFVELSKTEEYKNYNIIQSVDVGDTVTIRYDKLKLNLKAKVIKITKNIMTGNLDKVEFGNFKGNIATTFNNMSSTLSNITTADGQVKGNRIQGIIDATKASLRAMSDSAVTQVEKCILFEDRDVTSPTYGATAIGTSGLEISGAMTNNEWQWTTMATGKGIVADTITAGTINGNMIRGGIIEGASIKQMNGAITLNEFGKNDNGGLLTINDNYGNRNVKLGAETAGTINVGGIVQIYNDGSTADKQRAALFVHKPFDAGTLTLMGSNGVARVMLTGQNTDGAGLYLYDSTGTQKSYISVSSGSINGSQIATQAWVNANYVAKV